MCYVYCLWFSIVNLKGECPDGSKDSGFRTCIQGTSAYVPSNASKNPLKKSFYPDVARDRPILETMPGYLSRRITEELAGTGRSLTSEHNGSTIYFLGYVSMG